MSEVIALSYLLRAGRLDPDDNFEISIFQKIRKINDLTAQVEEHWEQMKQERRDGLASFAYNYIGEKINTTIYQRCQDWFDQIYSRLVLIVWLVFHLDNLKHLVALEEAIEILVQAILNAIERENLEYQNDLAQAIEEALSSDEKFMTLEEAREQVKSIFDSAISEL